MLSCPIDPTTYNICALYQKFIGGFWKDRHSKHIQLGHKKTTQNRTDRTLLGLLEVVDDLGDVGVHLVKLGVLGGRLPVLAAGHSPRCSE